MEYKQDCKTEQIQQCKMGYTKVPVLALLCPSMIIVLPPGVQLDSALRDY
jgi:hypothetical protein